MVCTLDVCCLRHARDQERTRQGSDHSETLLRNNQQQRRQEGGLWFSRRQFLQSAAAAAAGLIALNQTAKVRINSLA